jgi:uncharacterized protein with PIN domain
MHFFMFFGSLTTSKCERKTQRKTQKRKALFFLVDVMLAKLGRWLRILGVNAEDPEDKSDDAILFQAKSKNLILLTMDEELAERARRLKITTVLIPHRMAKSIDQLFYIVKKFRIPLKNFVERTLCTKCGGELEIIDSKDVAKYLPPNVLKRFKEVWRCVKCGHLYWPGSHWKQINETVARIEKKCRKKQ